MMTTYFSEEVPEREKYAFESMKSLLGNLQCTDGMRLIVSDDSADRQEACYALAGAAKGRWGNYPIITNSEHSGIGASLNLALTHVTDEWMYTTDDWVLTSQLSLDGPLRLLRDREYDLVRLGPIHPDLQCVTRFDQTIGWWLDLRAEYGGFAFATRPFIATKKFYDKVGPFDEMLNSYETERLYAERVARSTCKLAYWGGVDLAGPWEHVGIVNVGYKNLVS